MSRAVAGCDICMYAARAQKRFSTDWFRATASTLKEAEAAVIEHADVEHKGWRELGPMAKRTDKKCHSILHHGPGHQSRSQCEKDNDGHEDHQHILGNYIFRWKGDDAFSGPFDESPL